MAGLDWNVNDKNLTVDTYCDAFPCVGSLPLAEPTTTITDYILFVELVVLGLVLVRPSLIRVARSGKAAAFWGVGFVLLGISFLLGGTEHGFAVRLKCEGRDVCIESSWVWVATLLTQTPALSSCAVGSAYLVLTSGCAVYAVFGFAALNSVAFTVLALAGALVTADWATFFLSFNAVILFSVPNVLIVLVLFSLTACGCRRAQGEPAPKGSIIALVGWIVSIIALGWQATGIGFAENFNHNDIFHVIFMIGSGITGYGLNAWLGSSRSEGSEAKEVAVSPKEHLEV